VTARAVQDTFGGSHYTGVSASVVGDAFVARVDLSAESPLLKISCEGNAAALTPNLVSPGEIISLFGTRMGPVTGVAAGLDADGRLPKALAGSRVLFDGNPAPLLYVSADQINVVAPFGLAERTTTQVQVEFEGTKSDPLLVRVTGVNPGIFTVDGSGSGQAAALNEDGSLNSTSNPARPGSIMVLYATGAGLLKPTPEDGTVVGGLLPTVPATLQVGRCPAEVLYSGSAPGLVAGTIQVNFRVPSQPSCLGDSVEVDLTIHSVGFETLGGVPSQAYATISVR
jgi:uncharacterized protein (TIGR03437 family)